MAEHRDRSEDRHVVNYDGDRVGEEAGVAAIVKAFMKNPGGALQIVVFIGSMYGVYYSMNSKIEEVRAAQVSNFDKLTSAQQSSYDKLNNKIDALTASDQDERTKIDSVYTRGDTRYTAIISKLSAHDVDIAKIVASLDFIVDQYKNHDAHDTERAPQAPPRVHLTPMSPVP